MLQFSCDDARFGGCPVNILRALAYSLLIAILASTHLGVATQTRAETWRVASMEGFGPFNYTDKGEYTGIDVTILDEAAESIGVTLEHLPMPWKRALLTFERKEVDAVFQLSPTPERFEKWTMVGPLRTTRTVFAVPKEHSLRDFGGLEDLDGLLIGVVAGFVYESEFDRAAFLTKEEAPDDFANIRMMLLGRTDIIVGGYATLNFVARDLGVDHKLRYLPTPLIERARYIAFHRTEEGREKGARLQEAIDAMHVSGRIQEIIGAQLPNQ